MDLRTAGEPLLGLILQYGKQVKGSDSSLAALALQHQLAVKRVCANKLNPYLFHMITQVDLLD